MKTILLTIAVIATVLANDMPISVRFGDVVITMQTRAGYSKD